MKELIIEEDVTDAWKKNQQYIWKGQYFELEDNKINAHSGPDENIEENKMDKRKQLVTEEYVTDASRKENQCDWIWQLELEANKISAHSEPDENIEDNRTDRAMEQLVVEEAVADISFHQIILYSKTEENKKEKWR